MEDADSDVGAEYEEDESIRELNENINELLEDIANDMSLPKSVVKLIYLVYIESGRDNLISMKALSFVHKNTVKLVIGELQNRLKDIL